MLADVTHRLPLGNTHKNHHSSFQLGLKPKRILTKGAKLIGGATILSWYVLLKRIKRGKVSVYPSGQRVTEALRWIQWESEVKNRKVRWPGWDTDKHKQTSTHTHTVNTPVYTLRFAHGTNKPNDPRSYDYNPPYSEKGWAICTVDGERHIKGLLFTTSTESQPAETLHLKFNHY